MNHNLQFERNQAMMKRSRDDDDIGLTKVIVGCVMATIIALALAVLLTSCSVAPAAKYQPGENFGNSGATRCNTVQRCVAE